MVWIDPLHPCTVCGSMYPSSWLDEDGYCSVCAKEYEDSELSKEKGD